MREAIIRLNNKKDDAELCIKQNEKITFKMLSKEELVKLFKLGAADESLIELPQQLGLLRPFDRIVADETAHGIHGQAVAACQKERNTFAVVNYIVKRRRPGHALQLETVITLLVEHGRVDDRLRQGRHLLQVNIFGVVADDAA